GRHQVAGARPERSAGDRRVRPRSPKTPLAPAYHRVMVTVLYFARLREALGKGSEQMQLSPEIRDVESLRALLIARGGAWAREFAPGKRVRAGVNEVRGGGDREIVEGDEIAFSPPVTGG